jgi:cytochrome c-type biogenesis protein CcmH/NrfF
MTRLYQHYRIKFNAPPYLRTAEAQQNAQMLQAMKHRYRTPWPVAMALKIEQMTALLRLLPLHVLLLPLIAVVIAHRRTQIAKHRSIEFTGLIAASDHG